MDATLLAHLKSVSLIHFWDWKDNIGVERQVKIVQFKDLLKKKQAFSLDSINAVRQKKNFTRTA